MCDLEGGTFGFFFLAFFIFFSLFPPFLILCPLLCPFVEKIDESYEKDEESKEGTEEEERWSQEKGAPLIPQESSMVVFLGHPISEYFYSSYSYYIRLLLVFYHSYSHCYFFFLCSFT